MTLFREIGAERDPNPRCWGIDTKIRLQDTKWTGSTTRCTTVVYRDGRVSRYLAGPYGGRACSQEEFESADFRSRETILINLSEQFNTAEIDVILNAALENIFAFEDEINRGEVFSIQKVRSIELSGESGGFRVNVAYHRWIWCESDSCDGQTLIRITDWRYLPDRLTAHDMKYSLLISADGEMLGFDNDGVDAKETITLDNPSVTIEQLADLLAFAGFSDRQFDEETEKYIEDFLNSTTLSASHLRIRDRIRPLLLKE